MQQRTRQKSIQKSSEEVGNSAWKKVAINQASMYARKVARTSQVCMQKRKQGPRQESKQEKQQGSRQVCMQEKQQRTRQVNMQESVKELGKKLCKKVAKNQARKYE